MCGISGVLSFNNQIDRNEIIRSHDSIKHRGPDSEGFFFDKNIALAHRRLAIIDLSKDSDQPFSLENRFVIVFNGEIYNYIEIREELKTKGHYFKTESDTEVLLRSYIEWGSGCQNKFNGMWAFAIWDKKRQQLFCSRDRYGIKPFFWTKNSKSFYFGSELKQFIVNDIGRQCNYEELSIYLYGGCTNSTNQTFFKGINSLEPGHSLLINYLGEMKINKWYDLEESINPVQNKLDLEEFNYLLTNSIKLRMRSDVKVGSALSGGLDSSTILKLASNTINNDKNNIFAIHAKSSEKVTDESDYARIAANYASSKLIIVEPSFEDFKNTINEVIFHQDEPFASTSDFMLYKVMQKAKELGCKVMLDGQGSDEILMGYSRYVLTTLISSFRRNGFFGMFKDYRYAQLNNAELNHNSILKYLVGGASSRMRASFVNTRFKFLKLNIGSIQQLYKDVSRNNASSTLLQTIEFKRNTLPQILRTQDRLSMANSIEGRVPFLDYRLVEYCLNLRSDYKVKDGWTKYPLRISKNLPKEISWRKSKLGYDSPSKTWLGKYSTEMLSCISKSPMLKEITDMHKLKSSWKILNSKEKWRLFNVAVWQKIHNVDF